MKNKQRRSVSDIQSYSNCQQGVCYIREAVGAVQIVFLISVFSTMDRELKCDWVNNTTSRIRVIHLLAWIKVTADSCAVIGRGVRLPRIYCCNYTVQKKSIITVWELCCRYRRIYHWLSFQRAGEASVGEHITQKSGCSLEEVSRLGFLKKP